MKMQIQDVVRYIERRAAQARDFIDCFFDASGGEENLSENISSTALSAKAAIDCVPSAVNRAVLAMDGGSEDTLVPALGDLLNVATVEYGIAGVIHQSSRKCSASVVSLAAA